MRLGVIDCGTNTFHLLIAQPGQDGTFETVYKERHYVRLGKDGLDRIGPEPFERGIDCIMVFKKIMETHGVQRYRAFGTEALRRASNGREFIEAVQAATGVQIQLISGTEEARLIHLGVRRAVPVFPGKALIMDIGGGSVEFIISSEEEVFWAQSFPIGVQVLFSGFQKHDPISAENLAAMERHLEEVLQPLLEALKIHDTPLLLGASGSFEVVEDMMNRPKANPLYSEVTVEEYYGIHRRIIAATFAERHEMPGLPPERVELIQVAFALIDFIVKKANIRRIVTSAYAMKEGILLEMMEGQ